MSASPETVQFLLSEVSRTYRNPINLEARMYTLRRDLIDTPLDPEIELDVYGQILRLTEHKDGKISSIAEDIVRDRLVKAGFYSLYGSNWSRDRSHYRPSDSHFGIDLAGRVTLLTLAENQVQSETGWVDKDDLQTEVASLIGADIDIHMKLSGLDHIRILGQKPDGTATFFPLIEKYEGNVRIPPTTWDKLKPHLPVLRLLFYPKETGADVSLMKQSQQVKKGLLKTAELFRSNFSEIKPYAFEEKHSVERLVGWRTRDLEAKDNQPRLPVDQVVMYYTDQGQIEIVSHDWKDFGSNGFRFAFIERSAPAIRSDSPTMTFFGNFVRGQKIGELNISDKDGSAEIRIRGSLVERLMGPSWKGVDEIKITKERMICVIFPDEKGMGFPIYYETIVKREQRDKVESLISSTPFSIGRRGNAFWVERRERHENDSLQLVEDGSWHEIQFEPDFDDEQIEMLSYQIEGEMLKLKNQAGNLVEIPYRISPTDIVQTIHGQLGTMFQQVIQNQEAIAEQYQRAKRLSFGEQIVAMTLGELRPLDELAKTRPDIYTPELIRLFRQFDFLLMQQDLTVQQFLRGYCEERLHILKYEGHKPRQADKSRKKLDTNLTKATKKLHLKIPDKLMDIIDAIFS